MINPLSISDRTILVTGASSGIGRETAILLSKLGARLILVGRNQQQLEITRDHLQGVNHVTTSFDLSLIDDIPMWLKGIAKEHGPMHGLVHSAGVQATQPLRIVSAKDIEDVMKINVFAALGLAKGYRQKGVNASGGSIVFLCSVMGLVGQTGQTVYSASKGALVSLTKSLALELARERIRVNCVAPAMVKTEMSQKLFASLSDEQIDTIEKMHPLGIGAPIDIAYAIAFLLGETGRWVTGTTLVVDGGYTAQ